MPRRTPREHYDDDSNDSEDRDRLPRRSRHDSDSEDDMDYRPRKPNAPVDELDSLRIRERPPPKYLREDFSSRRNSRRSSPRRTPKDIEDVPAEKGEWSANAGGYASDEEEESIGGDRRRRREPIRPLESDYERRGSYSRRRDRAEVDFDYGERDNFNNSDFRSPSPRRHYPYEEDEDETRTRKHRREKRGRTHRREDPYEDGFEIREHRKPPPRFLEPQAESSSHNEWDRPSPELHRDDDEEIRIREGTIGRRGRHHRRDDSDDEEFETRRHRRSPPRFIEPSDEPWGRNERHRSPSRPRHYSDDEDEEIRMRKDTRGRRGRKLRMEDRDDDEFETRKHSRSPLRFIEPRGDPLPQDEWGRPPPRSPYPNDHEEIRILKDAKRRGKARIGDDRDEDEFLAYKHRRSSPPKYPEPRDDPWGQNEWDRSPGPRHHPSDDEDELRMREGARRRRARSPRKDNRGDDEFLIRKHRSPPRFAGPRDGRWEPVEWDRGRDHGMSFCIYRTEPLFAHTFVDYELSEPPRAPSPGLRLPKHSLDGLKRRHQ